MNVMTSQDITEKHAYKLTYYSKSKTGQQKMAYRKQN